VYICLDTDVIFKHGLGLLYFGNICFLFIGMFLFVRFEDRFVDLADSAYYLAFWMLTELGGCGEGKDAV
jgi:hypothetical protein